MTPHPNTPWFNAITVYTVKRAYPNAERKYNANILIITQMSSFIVNIIINLS